MQCAVLSQQPSVTMQQCDSSVRLVSALNSRSGMVIEDWKKKIGVGLDVMEETSSGGQKSSKFIPKSFCQKRVHKIGGAGAGEPALH